MAEAKKKRGRPAKAPGTQRIGLTIKLEPDTKRRLARAAYWTRQDVTAIVEALIVAKLARMEKQNGGPFEATPDEEGR